ncbi:holo-[acyl-carrier-protein] synthase [mine drainage metagenome]|jgi:holo-[acyl-carrier protein] synthase|uniref:Holo-[acyl-carrier-protein] synthase n=1 Tax=mine drainage metagenome TaxID=410659 RepID=A0A1J5QYI8_9ZZZZ
MAEAAGVTQAPAPRAALWGIGTDLCEVERVAQAWQRHGQRFAERILGPIELDVFAQRIARSTTRGHLYLATRFAAKEACAKALGLGLRTPMTLHHCEIVNAAGGRPDVLLHAALADWCAQRSLRLHVSLSDESRHALAFAVAEIVTFEAEPSCRTPR